jgi:hypothetical protein
MQLTKTVIETALGEEITGHMDSGLGRTGGFRVLQGRYGAAASPGTRRPGHSGAHQAAIWRKPMRTPEIAAPVQRACGLYQPRSGTPVHQTRPTGRLARP